MAGLFKTQPPLRILGMAPPSIFRMSSGMVLRSASFSGCSITMMPSCGPADWASSFLRAPHLMTSSATSGLADQARWTSPSSASVQSFIAVSANRSGMACAQ